MTIVVLFDSIHHVLAAERLMQRAGLGVDLVPVPKELSSDCGMALTLDPGDLAAAREALAMSPWRTAWTRRGDDWESLWT